MNDTSTLPKRRLGSTELLVSVVGFGGSHLDRCADQNDVNNTVHKALSSGINLFDTSPSYGDGVCEARLGQALTSIPRTQFYLQTKCGDEGSQNRDYSPFSRAGVLASVENSLEKQLMQPYVDSLLLHDCYENELKEFLGPGGGMEAIIELKAAGKIKHFGLGCREHQPHIELLKAIGKEQFQISVTVDDYNLMRRYLNVNDFSTTLRSNDVGIINGAPLYRGLLTQNPNIYGTAMAKAHPKLIACSKKMSEWAIRNSISLIDLAVAFPLQNKDIACSIYGCKSSEEICEIVNSAAKADQNKQKLEDFEREMKADVDGLLPQDHFYWFKKQNAETVEWPEMSIYPRTLWKDAIYTC